MRNKAQWELVKQDNKSEGPARRTGHSCVTFGSRIYMYVFITVFGGYFLTVRSKSGSVEQIRNIIITTHGASIPILGSGPN